jgi:hypothetical protein
MNLQSDADNKHDIEAARAAAAKVNLADVLTQTRQKQKRNLPAWADIAIVLGLYGVPLTHVRCLCLQTPSELCNGTHIEDAQKGVTVSQRISYQ